MTRVVVLGSSNTDMTVRLPRLPAPGETLLGGAFVRGPGGKGANQAVAARRAGAEVVFLTAVGDDALGSEALDRCRNEGIDVTHARVVAGEASGVALVFVAENGENMIGVAPGANARLTPGDVDALPDSIFEPGGVFLASLEVPLETVARGFQRAQKARMTTVLNPAPLDRRILDGDFLLYVNVLTPNEHEANELFSRMRNGRTIERTGSPASGDDPRLEGVRVVTTLGDRGCMVARGGPKRDWQGSRSNEALRHVLIPSPVVDVVDAVGAGDAFNGALAVALAEGRLLPEAAAWACAAGALATTRRGAQGALPDRDQIDRLYQAPPLS